MTYQHKLLSPNTTSDRIIFTSCMFWYFSWLTDCWIGHWISLNTNLAIFPLTQAYHKRSIQFTWSSITFQNLIPQTWSPAMTHTSEYRLHQIQSRSRLISIHPQLEFNVTEKVDKKFSCVSTDNVKSRIDRVLIFLLSSLELAKLDIGCPEM